MSGFQSILIPAREAEPIVAPLRRGGDWSSGHGVPAHLTIAGPWSLAVELPRRALAETRAAMRGERFVLGAAGMLGDAICLFPEDDAPLLRWRARILELVGHPDRLDEDWRIHLTVGRGLPRRAAREAQASLEEALPVACAVDGLLLAQMREGSAATLLAL